ncbi:MAG: peptidylprolyl isomerase [Henriciella sp.]
MPFFRIARSILISGGLALLLSGCGEQAPSSSSPAGVEAVSAAWVNEEPIYLVDVELEAIAQGRITSGETFGRDHPDFRPVLDQLIDQRLLAQEAVRRGLDQGISAQRRLAAGRERLLGNILVENLVTTGVTETAIDEMYREQVRLQQLDDEVRLRHILLPSEEEAMAVADQLAAGMDFTELALRLSQDIRTRIDGGSFGWVSPNDMAAPFPEIIANTPTGTQSPIFQSEQGWHVLRVDERRTRPPMTRAEMRPEIITFLTLSQISEVLRDLRTAADIRDDSSATRPVGDSDTSTRQTGPVSTGSVSDPDSSETPAP